MPIQPISEICTLPAESRMSTPPANPTASELSDQKRHCDTLSSYLPSDPASPPANQGTLFNKIASLWQRFCNWFSTKKDTPEPVSEIDIKSSPSQETDTRVETSEMTKLLDRAKEISDDVDALINKDPSLRESTLHQTVLFLMKQLRESMYGIADVHNESISSRIEENKQLQSTYAADKNSVIKHQKSADALATTGTILQVSLIIIAIAGTLLSLGQALAPTLIAYSALSATLSAIGGIASVSKGAVTIGEGVVRYNTNQLSSELLGRKEQRDFNRREIQEKIKELHTVLSSAQELWKNQMQINQNTLNAVRMA